MYEATLREYHFNVQLGWDRTKFFLLLNAGLISAGVGLFSLATSSVPVSFFLIALFLIALFISLMGLETTKISKSYYREAIFTKTAIERELGLLNPVEDLIQIYGDKANFSIAVTQGQRDLGKKLNSGETPKIKKKYNIVKFTRLVFISMIGIEIIAMCVATVILASNINP